MVNNNRYKGFMAIFFLSIMFSITLTSAFSVDIPQDVIKTGGNYSINVNNTEHFGGYTVSEFVNYIQGLFDSVYCKLTGCTMEGNINMGSNNITSVKMINITEITGACSLTAGAGISKNSTHYCFA
jgi:hypothetical protein